jgi:hypothetical protein
MHVFTIVTVLESIVTVVVVTVKVVIPLVVVCVVITPARITGGGVDIEVVIDSANVLYVVPGPP